MIEIDRQQFAEMVADAVAAVPPHLAEQVKNVAFLLADRNESEPELLGLYEGVPLTERGDHYVGAMPDRITIYRLPILQMCSTAMEVATEVRVTVFHEIAHHFGIDDHDLGQWGWG